MLKQPVPENEMDRIIELSELDLDYAGLHHQFKDLTTLAAKVAGTSLSLINLIDSFTSWTISGYGMDTLQMPREEVVCQYTIMEDEKLEIADLSKDERFKDKPYVTQDPNLRYYFGVPLRTPSGNALGTLCFFDPAAGTLSPEKIELLKLIGAEVVQRLLELKTIRQLKNAATQAYEVQKRIARDIKGPISGIIGLTQVISEQGSRCQMDEVLDFMKLISGSGRSLLALADEILTGNPSARVIAAK